MSDKGRPTLLNKQLKEIAAKMAKEKGMTLDKLAQRLNIARSTLFLYLQKDKDFSDCIKKAMAMADDLVEIALFERAVGYSHDEEKIFCNPNGKVTRVKTKKQYAPSEAAMSMWLKCRRPERWADTKDDAPTDIPINIAGDESDL